MSVCSPGRYGEGMTRERADAARNSARVLEAAEAVFRERDPRGVTMDEIARAAGVGRATLYRRFPDTRSIAVALLDERERDLQARLLSGEAPLGPGGGPVERLRAFLTASVDLLDDALPLLLAAESGPERFRSGAYGFWRAHVIALLREAGVAGAGVKADLLLAMIEPELFRHLRADRSAADIAEEIAGIATAVVTARAE